MYFSLSLVRRIFFLIPRQPSSFPYAACSPNLPHCAGTSRVCACMQVCVCVWVCVCVGGCVCGWVCVWVGVCDHVCIQSMKACHHSWPLMEPLTNLLRCTKSRQTHTHIDWGIDKTLREPKPSFLWNFQGQREKNCKAKLFFILHTALHTAAYRGQLKLKVFSPPL